jgi:hypothetical protein
MKMQGFVFWSVERYPFVYEQELQNRSTLVMHICIFRRGFKGSPEVILLVSRV